MTLLRILWWLVRGAFLVLFWLCVAAMVLIFVVGTMAANRRHV